VLAVRALPAGHGDCLWLEYGTGKSVRRILIDGGTTGTYSLLKRAVEDLPERERRFELVVVTHIDVDHVDGIVAMFEDESRSCRVGDVWFNGFPHLPEEHETFGPVSGERLTRTLIEQEQRWNSGIPYGGAIMTSADGPLPSMSLDGGLRLTVLSPGRRQLGRLRPSWAKVVRDAGLDPTVTAARQTAVHGWESFGPIDVPRLADTASTPDRAAANGSSIALLAEYAVDDDTHSVLLAGDAHPDVLEESIARLRAERGVDRLRVDLFKLPHHGSQSNVSRRILEQIDCRTYLVSTNGAYFRHPDREAMARVITYGGERPCLVFNYRTDHNRVWDDTTLMRQYDYSVQYPEGESSGIEVLVQ
jgi:beta-lactamase superfamily II metal-dependent hydrolase